MFRQTLRKAIASVSTTALLMSSIIVPGMGVSVAQAAAPDWAQPFVDVADLLDIANSVDSNAGGNPTRCEVAAMYVMAHDAAVGVSDSEAQAAVDDVQFADTSGNCMVYAELMLDWGLMFGQGGTEGNPSTTFGANDVLNKNDQAVVLYRYITVVLGQTLTPSSHRFSDVDYNAYYGDAIAALTGVYIFGEGGTEGNLSSTFGNGQPTNNVTLLVLIMRGTGLTDADGNDTQLGLPVVFDASAFVVGGSTNTGDGLVFEQLLSGSTIFPAGSSSNLAVAYKVTNKDDQAVTISKVSPKRKGVSTNSQVANVYAYAGTNLSDLDDASRLTKGRNLTSEDNKAPLAALGLTISPGSYVVLSIRFDVSSSITGSSSISMGIDSPSDVVSTASSVSFSNDPYGPTNELNSTTVGTLEVKKVGTTSKETGVGVRVVAAQVRLEAQGADMRVKRLAFKVEGTLPKNGVQGAELVRTGSTDVIASVEGITGDDLLAFVFSPALEISEGDSERMDLMATFLGDNNDVAAIFIEEDADVYAIDTDVEAGARIDRKTFDGGANSAAEVNGTCSSTDTDCIRHTLKTIADLVFDISDSRVQDLPTGGDDVAVLAFSIFTSGTVTFNTIPFLINATDSGALGVEVGADTDTTGLIGASRYNVTDLKVVYASGDKMGDTFMGPFELTGSNDATEQVSFNETADLAPGFTKFYLTADLDDVMAAGSLNAAVVMSGIDADDSVGDRITSADLTPSSNVTGPTQRIVTSTVTMSARPTPASKTLVKGARADALCIDLTAAKGRAVKVTDVTASIYLDNDSSGTLTLGTEPVTSTKANAILNDVQLTSLDGTVLDTDSIDDTGKVTYNSLTNIEVASGGTTSLCFKPGINNLSLFNGYRFKVDLASTDVTAQTTVDGDAVTVSGSLPNGGTADSGTIITVANGANIRISNNSSLSANARNIDAGRVGVPVYTGSIEVDPAGPSEPVIVTDMAIKNMNGSNSQIASVSVMGYTNAQQTETAEYPCPLTDPTNSIYECSAMALHVPDQNVSGLPNDTDFTIMVNLTSRQNQSVSGLAIELRPTLQAEFQADGLNSGNTIEGTTAGGNTAVKLRRIVGVTASATGVLINDAGAALTATSTALTVDTVDATTVIKVGDAIQVGAETMYVTSVPNATTINVVRGVNNTTAAVPADNAAVSLFGTSNTLLANAPFPIRHSAFIATSGSKLTNGIVGVPLAGLGSLSATETVFQANLTVSPQRQLELNQGLQNSGESTTGWTANGFGSVATTAGIEGVNALRGTEDAASAVNDNFSFDGGASAGLNNYSRVIFWVRSSAAKAAGDLSFRVGPNSDLSSAPEFTGALPALVAGDWTQVEMDLTGLTAAARYYGINVDANPDNSATIDLDNVIFHNQYIKFTGISSANFTATDGDDIDLAFLEYAGSDIATGIVHLNATGLGADNTSKTLDITFIPTGGFGDVDFTAGTTALLKVKSPTNAYQSNATNATHTLTLSLGAPKQSPAGTDTPGGFKVSDGTTNFAEHGENSTDKVEQVKEY